MKRQLTIEIHGHAEEHPNYGYPTPDEIDEIADAIGNIGWWTYMSERRVFVKNPRNTKHVCTKMYFEERLPKQKEVRDVSNRD